jgi:topoisomerase-4 subunit A
LVESEGKEEVFITEHPSSQLEIVATDYRPVAELVFTKVKGVQKENQVVDLEAFIAVKGFKALGNQITTDKLKQVNLLEPLPYEAPEEVVPEELEVAGETDIEVADEDIQLDDDGQITLF